MKKIFIILLSAVVALSALTACTGDYPVGPMANNVAVSTTSQDVAKEGATFTTKVTADGFWAAYAPDWITVEPKSGNGDQTVTITVAPNTGKARTGKVFFDSAVGVVSSTSKDLDSTPQAEITVSQEASDGEGGGESEGTVISIADYLALGPNKDTYIVTGAVTRVVNTTYGNFDLTDGTGTIYVYGLLNEKLEDKVCWQEKDLAMGDVLTVKATEMKDYNGTLEIVNAVYISHTKSLIALEADNVTVPKEGGDFEVKAEAKGADVKVDFDADWITFNNVEKDGENITLKFTAAENAGVPRTALITVSTTTAKGDTSTAEFTVKQEGSILTVTVAEVLEAEDNPDILYRVTGYVSKVNDLTKGRIYVTDYTGTIYAYNTKPAKDAESTDLSSLGLGEGDVVTLIGYKTSYGTTMEIVGYVESFSKVEAVTVAEFLAKEVSAEKWYRLEGAVTKPNETEAASGNKFDLEQYGNFVLEDETGRTYVYGVLTGFGQTDKKQFGTLGVKETDIITIVGQRAAYKDAPQVGSAWYVSHKEGTQPEEPEEPELPAEPEDGKTISEMIDLADGTAVNSFTSLVTAVTARGFIATDGTKAIYVYAQGSEFNGVAKVGDKVQFSGTKTTYSNMPEITPVTDLKVVSSGNEVVYPEARDITADAESFTAAEAEFVSITGTLNKSGNYYNISLAGTEAKMGSIVYPTAELAADDFNGKKIKVTGYFNGLTGSGKYINIITTSIVEVQ